jgi:uncharacterized cupredoxin-like copper-binding protein
MYARWSVAHRSICVVVAVLAATGCSAAAAPPAAVNATLTEFQVATNSDKAASGSVTFTIKNDGTVVHEFVVLKTDLASDKLPTTADGTVDEESGELKGVDEVEDIAPGTTETLTVDLPAGHYVVVCNLPGHYAGGMRSSLEVIGAS